MPKKGRSGWTLGVVVGGTALALTAAAMIGVSSASETAGTAADAGVGQIVCPDVASALPAIPAQAKAEVDRNLTLLQTQISEAQKRLETSVGEGGANFVQNAILGPLADKRSSTISRIQIAIGRVASVPELPVVQLSTCAVSTDASTAATDSASADATVDATDSATADATDSATADPSATVTDSASADATVDATDSASADVSATDSASADASVDANNVDCQDITEKISITVIKVVQVKKQLIILKKQSKDASKKYKHAKGKRAKKAVVVALINERFATIARIEIAISKVSADPNWNMPAVASCSAA